MTLIPFPALKRRQTLWVSIIATIVLFYPIDVGAMLLLVPYLAWVSIATALYFAAWRLNSAVKWAPILGPVD